MDTHSEKEGHALTPGPFLFKITQMQSVSILSICVHPCFSFLLLALNGYCNVLFYFLGILCVMKLHHSKAHGIFKLRKHGGKTLN